MNLDEAQKTKVKAWIAEGLKLSEIQKRMDAEFGISMTYMEVRLLMDDLNLMPKDPPAPPPDSPVKQEAAGPRGPEETPAAEKAEVPAPGPGKVAVAVDTVMQPGTMVSGSVTFSDGNIAAWYLDQMGRLGLSPKKQGYRPSPEDIEDFQLELQNQLQKLGF